MSDIDNNEISNEQQDIINFSYNEISDNKHDDNFEDQGYTWLPSEEMFKLLTKIFKDNTLLFNERQLGSGFEKLSHFRDLSRLDLSSMTQSCKDISLKCIISKKAKIFMSKEGHKRSKIVFVDKYEKKSLLYPWSTLTTLIFKTTKFRDSQETLNNIFLSFTSDRLAAIMDYAQQESEFQAGIPPRLVSVFYSVFDPEIGPKVVFEVPEGPIKPKIASEVPEGSNKPTASSTPLIDFHSISKYIVPTPPLCGHLVNICTNSYQVMGYPVGIWGNRYPRNNFMFNLSFVFDRGADTSSYEPVVRKVARVLTSLE
ncbi:36861_t:CDS:2, partial [Racocetra persica]